MKRKDPCYFLGFFLIVSKLQSRLGRTNYSQGTGENQTSENTDRNVRRNKFNNTYVYPGWFHNRENEEMYMSFHAYNAEAWGRCNDIVDYDRSGDNIWNLD